MGPAVGADTGCAGSGGSPHRWETCGMQPACTLFRERLGWARVGQAAALEIGEGLE